MSTANQRTGLTALKIIAIAVAVILAMFGIHKCQAQTAGEFIATFQYSAGVDKAMKRSYGDKWIEDVIKPRLREAWKNYKSTETEAYKSALSEIFDDGLDPELLLKAETNQLQRILDSLAVRKERKAAMIKAAEVQVIEPNIGKAYSPRMLFVESFPIEGGGGSAPLQGPGASDSDIRTAAIVIVVVVSVLALAGYGAYALARGVR